MKPQLFSIFILFLVLCFPFSSAGAAEPRLVSSHHDWNVYVFTEGGNKVCYMVSKPQKKKGNYSKRGDVFAFLTHRPAEGTKDVFSYITGYSYKAGSDVTVEIDGKKFLLFTQDDTAWGPDAETDTRLAASIRKGSRMVVKGVSSRGTLTTDTFSLKGSTAAYNRAAKECGY